MPRFKLPLLIKQKVKTKKKNQTKKTKLGTLS